MEREPNPANLAFRSRLKMVAEKLGGVSGLARAAGFNESTVRQWVDGPAEPNRTKLVALATVAGVDVGWLATGEGPREREIDQGVRPPAEGGSQPPKAAASPRQTTPSDLIKGFELREIFLIVGATKAIAADLPTSDQEVIAARMTRALATAASPDGDMSRLDETDMQALARIVRKLIFTEENGG